MGCGGGSRYLVDLFDAYSRPRSRGYEYQQNDFAEKMTLLKKTYAEGVIDAVEYQKYKQRINENRMTFDDLVELRTNRLNSGKPQSESSNKLQKAQSKSEYDGKLNKLAETKQKVLELQEKISVEIKALQQEMTKMETLAETMLKANEEKAEAFIRQKLDLEENIQNLEKRHGELENQIKEIDSMIKVVQTKELELEALRIKEEVAQMNLDLSE